MVTLRSVGLVILFAASSALSASVESPPTPAGGWGRFGNGQGQFAFPYGIAIDAARGVAYVSDQYNYRISKFTLAGAYLLSFGSQGTAPGQLGLTVGLDVDPAGNVYVADWSNNRIQVFTGGGAFVRTWGSGGRGDGQFDTPTDVCVSSGGEIEVVDHNNNRIERFTPMGQYLGQWGKPELDAPYSIAEGAGGNFFVSEVQATSHISVWSPGGVRLYSFGDHGQGAQQVQSPAGIELDASGSLYVADFANDKIIKFTSGGEFLSEWGVSGVGPGQFDRPADVAVDGAGAIYVVDLGNSRVLRFAPTTTADLHSSWGALKTQYR